MERYTEDFETGWASNWYLGPGFQIVTDGGTKRLSGGGASDGLATYLTGDYWTEFSFGFKMKLTSGEVTASLRYNADSSSVDLPFDKVRPRVSRRYYVRFTSGGATVVRQESSTVTSLGSASFSFDPNQWYAIKILAVGGHVSVYVRDSLEPFISVTDSNPVPSGSIGLETKANTQVLFDDLEVVANLPCESTWTQTKTFPLGPDINTIAFNPSDSNVVYAGTEHAGLWRSTDGGVTWAEVGYSGGMSRLGKTQGIAVDPSDSKTVYAGWAVALDKSTDGGLHWTRTTLQETDESIQAVAVHPNTGVVYVAEGGLPGSVLAVTRGGILKSSDGGSSFQTILTSPAFAIAMPASSPSVLYVGTSKGVSKSTNGGDTWTSVYTLSSSSTTGVRSLVVDSSNANTVYAIADGVIKSTDGGTNWSKIYDGNQIFISASRPQVLYVISGGNISRSADGGSTWTATRPLTSKPYSLKTLAVDPSNPDKLMAGSWGQGIFYSMDGGTTWSAPTTFAGAADLGVAVAVHPTDSRKVYVGTSKGEVYSTSDRGDTWTWLANLGSGNAYQSLITGLVVDPVNPDKIYASNLEGVYKSVDRGVTWKTTNTGLTDPRIISLAIDPKNPDTLYAGTGNSKPRNVSDGTGMFYSTNGGNSWSKVSGVPAGPVTSIVVNSANTKVIYAAVSGFGIYKSTDAGANWSQVNSGIENSCVYTLAMDPRNPDVVYTGTTNSSYCASVVGKPDNIYKTTDGGRNWKISRKGETIFENIESLAVDPSNPNNVYAANHTERIWFSGDAGDTWTLANHNVIRHGAHLYLWAIAFDSTGSTAYLVTCGRGIFRNSVHTPETPSAAGPVVRGHDRSALSVAALNSGGTLTWPSPQTVRISPQTQDSFFNDDLFGEVRLTISRRDWHALRDTADEHTYYAADLRWNGVTVRNVGIRSRDGDETREGGKPGLRVDIDRYVSGQEFLGLKAFVLKNPSGDPSLLRESVTMKVFARFGMPTPRETHARLYVNDEYVGVYKIVESIDRTFIARVFGAPEGEVERGGYLFKYERGTPYYLEYLGSSLESYAELFKPQTRETDSMVGLYGPLEELIRAIGESTDVRFASEVGEYLDLRAFMKYLAIENFMAEIDGLVGQRGMNTFYLYRFRQSQRSQLIPSDKDNTFSAMDHPIDYHVDTNGLVRRAMAVPELRQVYLDTLVQCAGLAQQPDANDARGWLERELDREASQIAPAVAEDPLFPFSFDRFETEIEALRQFARTRPLFVKCAVANAKDPSGPQQVCSARTRF